MVKNAIEHVQCSGQPELFIVHVQYRVKLIVPVCQLGWEEIWGNLRGNNSAWEEAPQLMSPWFRTTWVVHCSKFRTTWVPTATSTTPPQLKTRWHPREYRKRFSSTLNECLKEGRPFFVSFSFFCLKRVILWVFLSWNSPEKRKICFLGVHHQWGGRAGDQPNGHQQGNEELQVFLFVLIHIQVLVFSSSYWLRENRKIGKQPLGVRVPLVDIWSSLLLTAHRFSIL